MAKALIIGCGPAGVSAAIYLVRAGVDTTIIYRDGGALLKADKIENYYGFVEPISGKDLVERGIEQAKRLGVKFLQDQVVGLGYAETGLAVETTAGTHQAEVVIIATGTQRMAPKLEGLARLEGKGVSYCAVCDAFFYRGKNVAVFGTGEYALHEVQALADVAGKVFLLTDGKEPTCAFPENVTIDRRRIAELEGTETLESVRFDDGERVLVSGFFVAVGVAGSADLAHKVGAETAGTRIVVDENMATFVPGLYAAGDCTGGMLQIAKAVCDGAQAAQSAIKYLRTR